MSGREKINIEDYYALRRKLWVEAMCAVLSRYASEKQPWNPEESAREADKAVAEFDKRFQPV